MTLAATVATAPLIAHDFERLSLASIPANVLVLVAVAPVMWLGMLIAVLGQLPGLPPPFLGSIEGRLLDYVAAVARALGSPSWAQTEVALPAPAAVIAIYLLTSVAACVLIAWLRRRRGLGLPRRSRIAAAVVVSRRAARDRSGLGAGDDDGAPADTLRVVELDVGQGDATLLQPPRGAPVLVDAGPPGGAAAAALADRGIGHLRAVFITHDELDHAGGLREVLATAAVDELVVGRRSARLEATAGAAGARIVPTAEGSSLRFGGMRIDVLWPPREHVEQPIAEANDDSLVLAARFDGYDALLTGDAEAEATHLDPGPFDVLKVAHHGSDDAGLPALLDRSVPRVALIGVGAGNSIRSSDPGDVARPRRARRLHAAHRSERSDHGRARSRRGRRRNRAGLAARGCRVRRLRRLGALLRRAPSVGPRPDVDSTPDGRRDETRVSVRRRRLREVVGDACEAARAGRARGRAGRPRDVQLQRRNPARRRRSDRVDAGDVTDRRAALPARRRRRALEGRAGEGGGRRRWRRPPPRSPSCSSPAATAPKGLARPSRPPEATSRFSRHRASATCRAGSSPAPGSVASGSTRRRPGRLRARIGDSTERLGGELDRLALWAGQGGSVDLEDVERMTTDTSERAGWALADAIVSRDLEAAVGTADVLMDQGGAVTPLVYGMASRLRSAYQAAAAIEAGTPASKVEAELPMAPYPSKMLVRSVQGVDSAELSARDRRDRRPRVVDPWRLRLQRRGRADALGPAGGPRGDAGRVIAARVEGYAEATARAARAFLRAPVFACRAPFWTALSIREINARCSLSTASESPDSTALSRRRKCVLTAPVRRRFSSCSRSERRILFFCEAMLAISGRTL